MLLICFEILNYISIFVDISTKLVIIIDIAITQHRKTHIVHKNTNNMETFSLKSKKVVLPSATLRQMTPGMTATLSTNEIKTSILRSTASKLKQEGYLFRVSDKGLTNETIVECIKTPKL